MSVISQDIVCRPRIQSWKIIDASKNIFELFCHDAPMVPLSESLQPFFERALDRFGERFTSFLRHLPRQAFRLTVLYAQGHC
jgi:hypothetical protein